MQPKKQKASLSLRVQELVPLVEKLKKCRTTKQKCKILREEPLVQRERKKYAERLQLNALPLHEQLVIDSLFAIDQSALLFQETLPTLLQALIPVEKFYDVLGGIVGYHLKFLQILTAKGADKNPSDVYQKPPGLDISQLKAEVHAAIRAGIESLEAFTEIYVAAGAADRLDLRHEITGEPLPAAQLRFLGKTLLEGLIRDLEAREYLFFQLTGRHIITPVVLMTSLEKQNDLLIREILESHSWFNRPIKSFYFLKQPLVPVICKDGSWATTGEDLVLKPGGHGVLWKLAKDQGALEWLKRQKRTKALIRQINNPMAGLDYGLLALAGKGYQENRVFGFASCKRVVQSSEGMDILIERKHKKGYSYLITNVEYTDFARHGVKDTPENSESSYSHYPANTNILFADLKTIEKTLKVCSIPGLLINMKPMSVPIAPGKVISLEAGRLESTMQNIADYIWVEVDKKLSQHEKRSLPTFVVYNERHKTIAVAKKTYQPGQSMDQTPEGAFYVLLLNAYELLQACLFQVPPLPKEKDYLKKGPSFLFTYHPALGPLYSIIAQKLRRGKLHLGAELKLEIAELEITDLDLQGSLLIETSDTLGKKSKKNHAGRKCILRHVKVQNKGVERSSQPIFWKHEFARKEAVSILIEGDGEFYADNVTFKGAYDIVVPSGYQMIATQGDKGVHFSLKKLRKCSWHWEYSFSAKNEIKLEQKFSVNHSSTKVIFKKRAAFQN